MGTIRFRRAPLLGCISETVGYKSGLTLTREDLIQHAAEDDRALFEGSDDDEVSIRSEEFEELMAGFLYIVGNIRSPHILHPLVAIFKRFERDREARALVSPVLDLIPETVVAVPDKPVDLGPFVQAALDRYGPVGFKIAMEYVKAIELFVHVNPWSAFRQRKWKDATELKDQLAQIRRPHRRMFEREGYHVELGPGRGDDGIDLRLWRDKSDGPPTLLVQCKRQQEKIEKMVVKSLFADVDNTPQGWQWPNCDDVQVFERRPRGMRRAQLSNPRGQSRHSGQMDQAHGNPEHWRLPGGVAGTFDDVGKLPRWSPLRDEAVRPA